MNIVTQTQYNIIYPTNIGYVWIDKILFNAREEKEKKEEYNIEGVMYGVIEYETKLLDNKGVVLCNRYSISVIRVEAEKVHVDRDMEKFYEIDELISVLEVQKEKADKEFKEMHS